MSRFLKTLCFSISAFAVSNVAYAGCNSAGYCSKNTGISSTQNYQHFSGSTTSVPGLGHNESLRPTQCPVNVYNPKKRQVLGCYDVVKPIAIKPAVTQTSVQTHYYRIVRPVIYVRYPVPVAAPFAQGVHASASAEASAYSGEYGMGHGFPTRYGSYSAFGQNSYAESYASSYAQSNAYTTGGHYSGPNPCMSYCR